VREIVPRDIRLSVAIGDAENFPGKYSHRAVEAAKAGADIVKVGLLGFEEPDDTAPFLAEIRRSLDVSGFGSALLVAGLYADKADRSFISRFPVIVSSCGVYAALIDTYGKGGSTVRDFLSSREISDFARHCREAGILSVLAGGLGNRDAGRLADAGIDIAGFRSAVAGDGRGNIGIDAEKLKILYGTFDTLKAAVSS